MLTAENQIAANLLYDEGVLLVRFEPVTLLYTHHLICMCSRLWQGNVQRKIEAYHGPPPRDMSDFSLWICGVCLSDARTKMDMLSTLDTLERLTVGLNHLRDLVNRLAVYIERAPSEEDEEEEEEQMIQEDESMRS